MRRMLPRIMTLGGRILKKPFDFSSDTDWAHSFCKPREGGLTGLFMMHVGHGCAPFGEH